MFLEFFSSEEVNYRKERKENDKNLFTRKSSQQAKEEWEIFLGFLLILQLIKLERKAKKKRELNFLVFLKVFQTHKKKARKKLTWIIQWKSVNTDNWNECVSVNVMTVRSMYSPKLRLLA